MPCNLSSKITLKNCGLTPRLIKEKKELKMESKKIKLELKHLSAYLPYNLKVRVHDYKCDYVGREFDEVIGFHQWDKSGSLWSVLTCGGAKPSVEKVSPILRPLSDITRKELELEGFESHIDYLTYENKGSDWTLKAPFNMVQYLLSKHFDIFGLIEKGLAIDINTSKQ